MKVVLTTWVDPKTVVEPYSNRKNSPLGPQKVKNNPKIKLKSNVRIEANIENESCSTIWVEPKTVFEAYQDPKKVKKQPKNYIKIKL